jgi:hypothetical protein
VSKTEQDREQRLAAKLRENLRRRKEQAKARAATGDKPKPDIQAGSDDVPASLKPDSDSDS